MPTSRVHHKKNRSQYNIVLLPHDDAGKSWAFRMGIGKITLFSLLYTVGIGVLTISLLKWTLLGVWIPVKNPELERRYGKQISLLQDQLDRIAEDVTVLQRYNTKLRQALGSDMTRSGTGSGAPHRPAVDEAGIQSFLGMKSKADEPDSQSEEAATHVFPHTPETQLSVSLPPSNADSYRKSLPLRLPVNGYITRGFEPSHGHLGIDIAGRRGSPIVAAADGYILFAGWTYEAGYMMIIAHGAGYFTFYKHNQSLLKTANVFVRHGEPIALLGNTGAISHGPHLHFEVWKDGVPRDPSEYVLNLHLY